MRAFALSIPVLLLPLTSSAYSAVETAASVPRELVGSWTLVSRSDSTLDGRPREAEPTLGSDPVGFLVYDSSGHVAVQLMRRDRKTNVAASAGARGAANNTAYVGGYDAYFGTAQCDPISHTVKHRLVAAISPSDVGKELIRHYRVEGDALTLEFDATDVRGQQVKRRMTWRRVGLP